MIGSELIGKYIIVRGINSGVFAGTLENIDGTVVKLLNVRRIWYWDGAASTSELAITGPKKPDNCQFPPEVPTIIVFDAKEILEVSDVAEKAIKDVKPWIA